MYPLAAGLKAATVRDGHAQILVRIDGSVVNANFVVKMRTSRASAEANIADRVPTVDLLSGRDREAGKVAITSRNTMAMIHHDELAVSAHEISESNYAIGRCIDRVAVTAADIYPTVKRAFPVEGINPLTESGGDLPIDRPQVRSGVGPNPVGCRSIASHAQADAKRVVAGKWSGGQRAKLSKRRSYVSILNFQLGGWDQRRLRLQAVK